MEHLLICRTCLSSNLPKSSYMYILTKMESNVTIQDMLEIIMPEMDLEITDSETVVCSRCVNLLKNAYMFKNICLKTEEQIYDYQHHHDISFGQKIRLFDLLNYKMELPFTAQSDNNQLLPNKIANPPEDSSERYIASNMYLSSSLTFLSQGSNQSGSPFLSSNKTDFGSAPPCKEESKEPITSSKSTKKKPTKRSKRSKKKVHNSLKRHFTCDLCEYKAYRLDLLDTHKQKHNKDMLNPKQYNCEFCTYTTLRKRALDRHLFTHKGNSKHLCEICDKSFAEKYQLKLHMLTHTGEELPHKCEECGRGYLTKSYLKQHMDTNHLGTHPRCKECGQGKCGHSSIRYYKCDMCQSSFNDKRGLDAHKFTHTGGALPYQCLHCDFSTAWKTNLRKHLQNKH